MENNDEPMDEGNALQNMWAILIALAVANGGMLLLSPFQMGRAVGFAARMRVLPDGGVEVVVPAMAQAASTQLPPVTHEVPTTIQ